MDASWRQMVRNFRSSSVSPVVPRKTSMVVVMAETTVTRARGRQITLLVVAVIVGAIAGGWVCRSGALPDAKTWRTVGSWLSDWIRTAGFGGAAAVLAAAIAYAGVRRNVRVQREASRKEQWWDRAKWALDLTLSEIPEERVVGFAVLDALADSEWAQEHESDVIAAATEPALAAYLDQEQNGAVTDANEAQWDPEKEVAGGEEPEDSHS
jgi:hypothetical protein